ncbi:OmpA family protein [Pelomonas cellulosilytica]|uniref:OmpA family protein n=1 Tax=Pelomonas cellulosilytica TaxID=2906762 RepID=A0ABS8XSM2_9BURK|nr:OmpA family protein [Pelomonas sp. P8]MCE4555707.1 OmpA family protein [Pelomonas sp. P8]
MTPLRAALALLTTVTLASAAMAEAPKTDVAKSADHPVLKRFTGSVLAGYAQQDWEQRSFPDARGVKKDADEFTNPVALEGKVTRLFYLAPLGKSPLEVYRNYQQALAAAGFKVTWQCESEAQGCSKAYFALDKYERMKGMHWAEGDLPATGSEHAGSSWSLSGGISYEQARMLVGTLANGGRTLNLLLFTSVAENTHTGRAATYIEIVEPKAMPTGQVTVDAKAIGQGLQADGKIALYGLFFDTGKTDIKPDSNAQLDQMAALLKAQPALKVLIVGHTDNVGSIDANLTLSQGRAQAVVAALTQRGIAAGRLQARGVANFAPVASNAAEDGRARNRRVEMVVQ